MKGAAASQEAAKAKARTIRADSVGAAERERAAGKARSKAAATRKPAAEEARTEAVAATAPSAKRGRGAKAAEGEPAARSTRSREAKGDETKRARAAESPERTATKASARQPAETSSGPKKAAAETTAVPAAERGISSGGAEQVGVATQTPATPGMVAPALEPLAGELPAPPSEDLERHPPAPVVERVEGKGRRAIADPAAVAALLGDAAGTEAPLPEALPPVAPLPAAEEPDESPEARREAKRRRREARRVARRGEVVGTITLRPEGYGFLKRLEGPPGDDVFLPAEELHGVMDGDRLRVRLVRGRFGRDAGQLVEIVERQRRHLVGTFNRRGRTTFVVPADPTLPRFVPVRAPLSVRDGQVVKVAITQYPDEDHALLGDVEKVIGNPGDPIVEVLEIAYAHGFAEEFPADVLAEARRIPDEVTEADRSGRRDLTSLPLVTIDGEDARDFDDAVHVARLPDGGYRLTVAIADVAHYVRPGTRLDQEAFHRATSVYFPNHVLPMLPEKLSDGICSLNPHVERLCMVCEIRFDGAGRPIDSEIYEGRMVSHARCTYGQVARVLAGESLPELAGVEAELRTAGELARKLRQRRIERGSLDFDIPEARPILDEEMRVVDIVRRERNDAHRLIEEFMLAANEAVARHFTGLDLPSVYRVHGEPDPEKLERFAALARTAGFDFRLEGGITPVQLGEWLRRIEGTPQQRALNTLLLRSMMQAVYTPENIGHFGLGAECYLHFTSPIRRYPDLLVHRLLKQHWARERRVPVGAEREELEQELADRAAHASQRERAAMEAEREVDAFFKCLFAAERVGTVCEATVVSITDFGFFAELDPWPIEGLVRAEEIGTAWELDQERHRLVFGSGLAFSIGDRVQVQIAGIDLGRRQIALALLRDARGKEIFPRYDWGRPGFPEPRRRPRKVLFLPDEPAAPGGRRRRFGAGDEEAGLLERAGPWAHGPGAGNRRERHREEHRVREGGSRGRPIDTRAGLPARTSRFAAGDPAAALGMARGPRAGAFARGEPSGWIGEGAGPSRFGGGRKGGPGKRKQRPGKRERARRKRRR